MIHEILLAREKDLWEWRRELEMERPLSATWGWKNAVIHLREALDRRDLEAVRVWLYVLRKCREAERRSVFGEGDDLWRKPNPEARR